jgi:DnaK suppressor protein
MSSKVGTTKAKGTTAGSRTVRAGESTRLSTARASVDEKPKRPSSAKAHAAPPPKTASKPAAKAVAKAVTKTATKPVAKAAKSANKTVAKTATKPVAKTAAKPVAKASGPTASRKATRTSTTKELMTKPMTKQPSTREAVRKEPAKKSEKERGVDGRRTQFDQVTLAAIRKRLLEQRGELEHQLVMIEESALGLSQSEMSGEVSYDEDYADAGSFTFEREKEFSIANNVTDIRDQVERALQKIDEGTYGICESCGRPIEPPRLKALPHVALCLNCKKAEERR